MWTDKNKEILCGSSIKNGQRTYMKRIKDEMVERYLPINISRLNELIQKHAGPGLPPPPQYWNARGRPEIAPIQELADAHDVHQ